MAVNVVVTYNIAAPGSGTGTVRSTDGGVTWEAPVSLAVNGIDRPIWTGKKWLISLTLDSSGTTARVYASTDGSGTGPGAWANVTLPGSPPGDVLTVTADAATQRVLVWNRAGTYLAQSLDGGDTWQTGTTTNFWSAYTGGDGFDANTPTSGMWVGDRWLLYGGYKIWTCADPVAGGASWTVAATSPTPLGWNRCGFESMLWDGTLLVASDYRNPLLLWSSDKGNTWTVAGITLAASASTVGWDGVYYYAGSQWNAYRSSDGKTWVDATHAYGGSLDSVTYPLNNGASFGKNSAVALPGGGYISPWWAALGGAGNGYGVWRYLQTPIVPPPTPYILQRPAAQFHVDSSASQMAWAFTAAADGHVEVDYVASSEQNFDWFWAWVDSGAQFKASGSGSAATSGTASLSFTGAGAHTLHLAYNKDSSDFMYLDSAWISAIRVYEGPTLVQTVTFNSGQNGTTPAGFSMEAPTVAGANVGQPWTVTADPTFNAGVTGSWTRVDIVSNGLLGQVTPYLAAVDIGAPARTTTISATYKGKSDSTVLTVI